MSTRLSEERLDEIMRCWTHGVAGNLVDASVPELVAEVRKLRSALNGADDLTLRCPVCGQRADMCFEHGDDWKKRTWPP